RQAAVNSKVNHTSDIHPRDPGGSLHLPPLHEGPLPGQGGGFAKCYEITNMESREVFAGNIVPKSLLLKPHQKDKMTMGIAIQQSLDHQHVVGFHGFFEDNDFVFVVLELCRRSLLELHKRRKAVTEPEARYHLRQTILGCQYLHSNRDIHRDLKLGNLSGAAHVKLAGSCLISLERPEHDLSNDTKHDHV
uniref:Serine/threonine-protein kinase PLK1 n=1 Tax=Leptobrachium leishanense TaxID=445787 RepID=A0A8C5Q8Z5_9ANUR